MYFPFLRGKQFELLALKEVCALLKPSNKIHPIIEPVKESFQALERSLSELCINNISPTIIVNPTVGDLSGKSTIKLNQFVSEMKKQYQLNVGLIMNNQTDISKAEEIINKFY